MTSIVVHPLGIETRVYTIDEIYADSGMDPRPETCQVCGLPVRMQIYRNTGVCSQACEQLR